MRVLFTTDPATMTFTEIHGDAEAGHGDARDIEAMRAAGELHPELAAAWDAMLAELANPPEPEPVAERTSDAEWEAFLAAFFAPEPERPAEQGAA